MKVYLISGKSQTGKDTIGNYLTKDFELEGKKVCRLQISTYLKMYAIKYFGWDGKEETKPRELLQKLGTDIIRNKIDNEFHINRFIEDIKVLSYFFDIAICTDIRIMDEILIPKKKLIGYDIKTIHIIRPHFNSNLSFEEKNHITENSLDENYLYDYKIINDKDLNYLKELAHQIVKKEFNNET